MQAQLIASVPQTRSPVLFLKAKQNSVGKSAENLVDQKLIDEEIFEVCRFWPLNVSSEI